MKNKKQAKKRVKNKEVLLFGISGKIASGKDTVGGLLSSELSNQGFYIVETSFGKLIRDEIDYVVKHYNNNGDLLELASDEDDIDELVDSIKEVARLLKDKSIYERSEESRAALQFWGTNFRRNQNSNYWIEQMENFLIESILKGVSVNVTDARFPNEVDLILALGGKVARLEVPAYVRKQRLIKRDGVFHGDHVLTHESEMALDDYPFPVCYNGEKSPEQLKNEILYYILEK